MGNFASFCFRVNNNVEKANQLFIQALKLQPDHVNNLCKYATFLTKTVTAHKKALQKPQPLSVLANAADLSKPAAVDAANGEGRTIEDAIEELLQRACALEPTNATALSVRLHPLYLIVDIRDFGANFDGTTRILGIFSKKSGEITKERAIIISALFMQTQHTKWCA